MAIDYKSSGVDIEKGDQFVNWLQGDSSAQPHQDKVMEGIGGFASIFRMDFPNIKEPCLVSATDGIGTKLKLAVEMQKYDTLGQDLVAMCANDLICTGAQPLFFLDYFATSHLDMEQAKPFLAGVRKACQESQLALIGGETAEMPGLYQKGDFDCAGFAVGVVDRQKILGPQKVNAGHKLIGINSSGFHSNGFSLLRKVFAGDIPQWGEKLLTPTALYVNVAMELLSQVNISAIAHITGGGMNNIARVLPKNVQVTLQDWTWPEAFTEVMKRTSMSKRQMMETLNCGIGLVVILPEEDVSAATSIIEKQGFSTFDLGTLTDGSGEVLFGE